jgi:hypothetical protein
LYGEEGDDDDLLSFSCPANIEITSSITMVFNVGERVNGDGEESLVIESLPSSLQISISIDDVDIDEFKVFLRVATGVLWPERGDLKFEGDILGADGGSVNDTSDIVRLINRFCVINLFITLVTWSLCG